MPDGQTRRVIIWMFALLAAQACSSSSDEIPPTGSDASIEDVSSSEPNADHPSEPPPNPDTGVDRATIDVGTDLGPGGCANDQGCSAPTPRCDLATHTCVACLSGTTDNCPADQYCDPDLLTCKTGCKGDAACLTGACSPDHTCVECLPGAADKCPAGKYCSPQYTCLAGCKNDAACASGRCEASHDCTNCLTDLECAEGRVCSTGQCLATCATTPNCPMGSTCCGDHCADLKRDPFHCGDCTSVCSATQFCSPSGCKSAVLNNLCASPAATFLLDGLSTDDTATATLKGGLVASCMPAPAATVVAQDTSGLINPTTGKPVGGGGNLVVIAGGPFGQLLLRYLENTRATPIYSYYDANVNQLRTRAPADAGTDDGGADPIIVNAPQSTITDSHSFFVVELMLDPPSGTLMLAIYGVSAPGTDAAAWYFVQKMLPMRASLDKSWYVYEWTDGDGDNKPSDADTFTMVASSP